MADFSKKRKRIPLCRLLPWANVKGRFLYGNEDKEDAPTRGAAVCSAGGSDAAGAADGRLCRIGYGGLPFQQRRRRQRRLHPGAGGKNAGQALALADGGTIIVGSQQTINADKTLENATFRRAEGFTSTMFLVTGNAKLTLQNVTLDGANVAKSSYLVQASRGTTLNIGANAVLENNQSSAVYAYGATVNMTGWYHPQQQG